MNNFFFSFVLDQVVFSCHCKIHDQFKNTEEVDENSQFELVQFFGYFHSSNTNCHGDNSGILSSFNNEDDEKKLVTF